MIMNPHIVQINAAKYVIVTVQINGLNKLAAFVCVCVCVCVCVGGGGEWKESFLCCTWVNLTLFDIIFKLSASVWCWINAKSNVGLQSTTAWVTMDGLLHRIRVWHLQTTDLLTKCAKHSTYCYLPVSDTARLLVEPSKSEIRNLFKYRHIVILIAQKMPLKEYQIHAWLYFSHLYYWF
jgi:hypothetical protein